MGDHPPIVPTETTPASGSLTDLEEKVYEYVLRNFLGSISEEAVYEVSTAKIKFGDRTFTHVTKKLVEQGFLRFKQKKTEEGLQSNVSFVQGSDVSLESMKIEESWTQPPSHVTESELLSLMERYHIGTDASMATHIKNVIERGYVQVEGKGRSLLST